MLPPHERPFLAALRALGFAGDDAAILDRAAFTPVVVAERDVSVADAVATYLFNSQLLARPDGRMLLVAPAECRENARVDAYLRTLVASGGPIADVLTFDLKQSMKNGGGPACLRLRVALTDAERAAVRANVFLDDSPAALLEQWIRDITATGWRLPIWRTRGCSTNRGARWTGCHNC